ncbi:hypothetical protein B9Z19DRAFT_1096671 [Tuber borchii]|uniref:Uncharacterized protein n=1 Tax=Tuber borchii TaxID=42251 RepID=A0A2T6ZB89_TUBBO|nr:hypothetical protein B9Z19DRAFT_1096671 [Tuber borchii]
MIIILHFSAGRRAGVVLPGNSSHPQPPAVPWERLEISINSASASRPRYNIPYPGQRL